MATRKKRTAKSPRPAPDREPPEESAPSEVSAAAEPEEEGLFPIVGIGASAGGFEAFTEMLHILSADTGMGFVFVQHLDPKHVSMLTELLQRHTTMPVEEASEGICVEPNHVYVIPRNMHIGVARGVLTLSPRGNSATPHMPIDPFLRSLAADQKSKAIGVVLSGNASDGALGMMAIKAAGGITFAQSGESAKYDGMPRAALSSGCIDFVLSPQEIARELIRLGLHPYVSPAALKLELEPAPAALESIGRILGLLRTGTGVDFTHYKPNTIRRRILRRMALRQVEHLDRYIARLRSDPAELQALYDDILINVTEFFRDPDVFEDLKKMVFPRIVPDGQRAAPVRIWVPGCSSGEEVYSIAMALMEYLGDRNHEINVQIFGTDVSDLALDKARSGTYAPSIVRDISVERMRRFFTKVDSNYQVSKRIREMCVFAKQNLIKDPPFSKLDLISCRNVLIYLGTLLQKRLVPIFHYALNPNGYLILGSSETISAFPELFSLEEKKTKIFKRCAGTTHPNLEFPIEEARPPQAPARPQSGDWTEADLLREADRIVLGKYGPAGVVVDADLNVVQFRGRMAPFLEPTSGMASLNLLKLVREGLSIELRNAFQKARRVNAPVRRDGLRVGRNSTLTELNLEVIPFKKAGREPRYLILFEEVQGEPAAPKDKNRKKHALPLSEREAHQLRQDLVATKEYLQSVIEELESSNEELRSANEEIQSSNEELQSTNEELETAKEELQSSNEELNTVNDELQTRNIQLAQSGNDLLNLLSNVNIPIIMLGNDLRIRRFTPVSHRMLNLIPTDVGRPISDINLNLNIPKLDRLVAEVIDTLLPKATEVTDVEGRPYSLRIRPYRTEDNKIDGAVIVLVDLEPGRKNHAAGEWTGPAAGAAGLFADRPVAELSAFGAGLLIAQEHERRNLARELQDDLSQRLALLELNLDTIKKDESPPREWQQQLGSVHDQIASLSNSVRQIASQLHPAGLEESGIGKTLESLVREFGEGEGIQVRFQNSDVVGTLSPEVALCVYRIVQESLRNVARHSGAKTAEVLLSRTGSTIQLRVKDSGSGFEFDAARKKGGLGLRSMEERSRACGGGFKVTTRPGAGTEVLVEIPETATRNQPAYLEQMDS